MYKKRTVAVGRTPRSEYANWAEHRDAISRDAVAARRRHARRAAS